MSIHKSALEEILWQGDDCEFLVRLRKVKPRRWALPWLAWSIQPYVSSVRYACNFFRYSHNSAGTLQEFDSRRSIQCFALSQQPAKKCAENLSQNAEENWIRMLLLSMKYPWWWHKQLTSIKNNWPTENGTGLTLFWQGVNQWMASKLFKLCAICYTKSRTTT